jgi:galactitol-specific phosphotransferase system IIC component
MSEEYYCYSRCGVVGGSFAGGAIIGIASGIAASCNRSDIIPIVVSLSPLFIPCMAAAGNFIAGYCCLSSDKWYAD